MSLINPVALICLWYISEAVYVWYLVYLWANSTTKKNLKQTTKIYKVSFTAVPNQRVDL